jgi:hypothetical protein
MSQTLTVVLSIRHQREEPLVFVLAYTSPR